MKTSILGRVVSISRKRRVQHISSSDKRWAPIGGCIVVLAVPVWNLNFYVGPRHGRINCSNNRRNYLPHSRPACGEQDNDAYASRG